MMTLAPDAAAIKQGATRSGSESLDGVVRFFSREQKGFIKRRDPSETPEEPPVMLQSSDI